MLEGIKILSFTHFLQGPSAVQILADLGADVIKIEPTNGSYERNWSGFDAYVGDLSVFFALANRNQRSLAIDIKSDEGKAIIDKLIQQSDVLVENFRPGVLERLGFGFEKVQKMNSRMVYCSLSGYGTTGPYKNRPGQDLLVQAMSGLGTLSGSHDSPPTLVGTAIVDQHAAVLGALGIIAALYERNQTGTGKKVDSNLLNAALDLQIEPLNYYLNKGPLWERSSSGIATTFHQSPYGVFATKDDWIAISLTPIDKLKAAFGDGSLDPYTLSDQFHKREEVNSVIAGVIKQKPFDEWASIFDKLGIWYAPVNDYSKIVKDEQVEHNEMIITIEHPDVGELRLLNHPIRFNGQPPTINHKYPPRLGEHSFEILKDLGVTEEEIDELDRKGLIFVNKATHQSQL